MKFKTTPVKGTRDYAPQEMEIVQFVLDQIKDAYSQNGFNQIKTPILENLEILSSGDSGDNVKMMFKTIKRGAKLDLTKTNLTEKDITEEGLRYDLTVPLSRFYANNLNDLPKPFKVFQFGESFRAEKPQKARDREFIQCDIDMFGEETNLAEIEIILSVMQAYQKMGLDKVKVKINDRQILNELILSAGFDNNEISQVLIEVDKFDKIGFEGVANEMTALNFPKNKIDKLLESLKQIKTNGLNECLKYQVNGLVVDNLKQIIANVEKFKPSTYSIEFDVCVIRGQGYYTGTVFEAFYEGASFSRAIGGGGRYDNMLEKYLNTKVPAVGYGLGLVPCVIILQEQNHLQCKKSKKVCILYDSKSKIEDVLNKKYELMKEYVVCVMPEPKNYKNFIQKIQNLGYEGLYKLNESKLIWL